MLIACVAMFTFAAQNHAAATIALPLQMPAKAQVDSGGLPFSAVASNADPDLGRIVIAPSPAFGKIAVYTRAQIADFAAKAGVADATTLWKGSEKIVVTRRARMLEETELHDLLTNALQRDHVRDRGELELRLGRAWTPLPVPDEPITLEVMDLPASGLNSSFVVRFEIRSGAERVGVYQVPIVTKIMRDVLIARGSSRRGQLLSAADVGFEKRDLLTLRDALVAVPPGEFEFTENLQAGGVITTRSLRLHPVVRRGKLVEALIQEGSVVISMRAEALEDGAPGQVVRVRNLKSKREFKGKVRDEETILVSL